MIRAIDPADLMQMLDALGKHHREDRLHRALAHYRMALNALEPRNWVLAAESLYIAVENLSRVICQRLRTEAGLPDTGESKHQLAVSYGHSPKSDADRSHLNRFDAWIREHFVFEDDRKCFKDLVNASDEFEHGYAGFDTIRARTTRSARKAFGYIRRAILREIGVDPDSPLLAAKFDVPVGSFRPVVQLSGTYTDSATKPGPGFTREDFKSDWPDFQGPSVMPRIGRVVDHPDRTRSLDLTLDTHGGPLAATQTIRGWTTDWIVPGPSRRSSPK